MSTNLDGNIIVNFSQNEVPTEIVPLTFICFQIDFIVETLP
ncbi:hypothetical protein LEP1GSC036_1346 [Leptospira weilii str. 2006001853]|uniref:Uncharacterized protein n=4 Tax=Leptospira weilii TaxID=28184 RepID=A0A828Z5X7_9LEPT|nr:hypothetical protein LEP1GSC036_1346 [Leptospira weilii str. 2006001853]EMJ61668.1 hypothetical protein LEP1GSC051_3862 [Leptospira sp. P2653]EMM70359.1 hypothetical protein LEP1GSC038_0027 [Leptospira weilii str. 2006001855]EMN43162.1 hypothetical protein LEP1GSC086_0432 [Leptospira weilii str. LNT 1234]EMN89781.1 hypothetical protein LEP1GSC108_2483 [Leptospira weilii str. UI 13098]EMY14615.1 hypothetical protein LEP1GSC043_0217 [Leptospira weilii str. Ecochallenge]